MNGLKIKCPNCRRVMFETTDKYKPDVTPNGSMVKFLGHYALDWLAISTTGVSEMTCPECLAQLAPKNRLWVIEPPEFTLKNTAVVSEGVVLSDANMPVGKIVDVKTFASNGNKATAYPCPTCGKSFDTERAMSGHKGAAHKKEKVSHAQNV